MKSKKPDNELELSRPIAVDKISAGGMEQSIVADQKERAALAVRFGLLELPKLEAKFTVKPARGGRMFEVEGTMQADVVQRCVVTLEPLPARIEQSIKVLYASPDLLEADPGRAHPLMDMEAEETEAIIDGIIDLGELAAQHLGINLEPYPRKPGIAYVEAASGSKDESINPFTKLKSLTKRGKEKE